MSGLTLADVVQRKAGMLEGQVDDETMAMDVDQGAIYALNRTGSRIWAIIAQPKRIGDICAELTALYAVDPATCEREVLDILERLRADGVLRVQGSAQAPAS